MKPISKMSDRELHNAVWDRVILAIFGCSIGVFLALGAPFWRFVLRPWEVFIRYSDGEVIWRTWTSEPLFSGVVPPVIPMAHNVTPAIVFVVGVAISYICFTPWNDAIREIKARNAAKEPTP